MKCALKKEVAANTSAGGGPGRNRTRPASTLEGCSFCQPPDAFFQTARLVRVVFDPDMSFFDLQFFSTATGSKKTPQSFSTSML